MPWIVKFLKERAKSQPWVQLCGMWKRQLHKDLLYEWWNFFWNFFWTDFCADKQRQIEILFFCALPGVGQEDYIQKVRFHLDWYIQDAFFLDIFLCRWAKFVFFPWVENCGCGTFNMHCRSAKYRRSRYWLRSISFDLSIQILRLAHSKATFTTWFSTEAKNVSSTGTNAATWWN